MTDTAVEAIFLTNVGKFNQSAEIYLVADMLFFNPGSMLEQAVLSVPCVFNSKEISSFVRLVLIVIAQSPWISFPVNLHTYSL